MAEAHPVAFQWVVEAKARGATMIHVDPHYSRTSALADMFVPLRAGTDIAFLGAIINHVLRPSRTSASTSSPTPTPRRSSARTSGTRASTGCSPASTRSGSYDPESWQYEDAFVAAAAGSATRRATPTACRRSASSAGRAGAASRARRDAPAPALRVADPQAPLRRATRRRWSSGSAACPQDVFAKVCRAVRGNSAASADRVRARRRLDTAHDRLAVHPRRLDPAAAARQHGRPGGGVMAMRGHASIQGSSDIPTLFDTLPGVHPDPHAHAMPAWSTTCGPRPRNVASGATWGTTRSA